MIELLRNINQNLIQKYQNNCKLLRKQLIIYNILKKDDCFFKITIEDAYSILKDLEIADYENVYLKIISYSEYINVD